MAVVDGWLLLVHQLPPKPDYLRVKVRRRLRGVGAVPLKNTVYALPNTEEAVERAASWRDSVVSVPTDQACRQIEDE